MENTRIFGEEKNKLVIEPTGTIVIEFLIKKFDPLFVYPYTKNMEDTLDEIAKVLSYGIRYVNRVMMK